MNKTSNVERGTDSQQRPCSASPRLLLRYDKAVGCWLDKEGWAWTITATKRLVEQVRTAPQDTTCPLCGRKKFHDVHKRDLHMFNECPKR